MNGYEKSRWWNTRWFIVLSTLSILICLIVIIGWNAQMSAKKEKKRPQFGPNGELITQTDSVSVTLSWSPNPEPDIAGYELSYGTVSGIYTVTIPTAGTTVSITLNPGTGYFFAVRAVNTQGLTGPYSTEVPYTTATTTPTPSPRPTATATATATASATATATSTATATATFTPRSTATATATAAATASATATVAPTPSPDFTITVSPQTLIANQDGGYLVYAIDIAKSGGFSSPVILSANGLPDGVAMRFNPNPTPLFGSNLVLFCGFIPPGTYPFTVVGQSFSNPPITRTAPGMLFKPIPTPTP